AGACDRIAEPSALSPQTTDPGEVAALLAEPVIADAGRRRPALWQAGAASRASRAEDGTQLALPLEGSPAPELPPLGPWERAVADYRTTGITLGEHPMELMRPQLRRGLATSADLPGLGDGSTLSVAGMVVARQRPATAKGVVFMLLEDEHGTINLIVPPPVAERCRQAVRSAGFVIARGKLEHREGTTNVVVRRIERLEREGDGMPAPRARTVAPPESRETGHDPALADARRRGRRVRVGSRMGWEVAGELDRPAREQIVSELAAALPSPHSWGRRGR
ncbi:MAG: hypothetical protein FJW90_08450, partial [Actinobacteria bacterium]|nr:hypothetical protein [Actinomycetota bacterium]